MSMTMKKNVNVRSHFFYFTCHHDKVKDVIAIGVGMDIVIGHGHGQWTSCSHRLLELLNSENMW